MISGDECETPIFFLDRFFLMYGQIVKWFSFMTLLSLVHFTFNFANNFEFYFYDNNKQAFDNNFCQ